MPAPSALKGAPCWADLFSSDTDVAERFYGDLFGWTATHGDEEKYGGYITFSKGDVDVAGCMRNDGSTGNPDRWSVYLGSSDAAATAASAAEHGGTVYMEPMEVPEVGTMAMVGDPGGAAVGIWQPGPFAGMGAVGEPGLPAWFELHTRSYDQARDFYRDVFGWDEHVASDTPEFRYTTLGADDDQAAGIMDGSVMPDDAPMEWAIYFGVDDADAAVAKAASLGGKVVRPPEDTPYGRLATLRDPSGATFKIIQGNPA
jgi:predicted enzyme related to lactoylglutathione lyase